MVEQKQSKIGKIYNLIGYFYFYSFFGWLMETIYCFALSGQFTKRGYLYGIICPIYGFGAIILLYLLSDQRIKNSKVKKFITSMIICTVFELVVAVVLENFFNIALWDYSDNFLNLDGKICLISSVYWGILGLLLSEVIQPFISKKISKINDISYKVISSILVIITIVDFVFSTIKYIKL